MRESFEFQSFDESTGILKEDEEQRERKRETHKLDNEIKERDRSRERKRESVRLTL